MSAMLSSQTKDPVTAAALERMREVFLAGVLLLRYVSTAIERTCRASCVAVTATAYTLLALRACPDSSFPYRYFLSYSVMLSLILCRECSSRRAAFAEHG